MRIAPFFGVAALALWPGPVHALDMSDFTLKTTQDLCKVCSVAPDDPLREQALDFCEGFFAIRRRLPATKASKPSWLGRRHTSRIRSS